MTRWSKWLAGSAMMFPLSVAVVPWGILAGSVAVDAGFDIWQAQGMSLLVFAGAVQLVSAGMIKAGASLLAILLTTTIITSRHLLYGMALREDIKGLPWYWRMSLGFLLTDELFAIAQRFKRRSSDGAPHAFEVWYAFGAASSFYLLWYLASLIGIIMGKSIPNLTHLGLEFAIVSTFIAITIPTLVSLSLWVTVGMAAILSVLLKLWQVDGSLLLASIGAMFCGFAVARWRKESIL